jgi:hypothetical protein
MRFHHAGGWQRLVASRHTTLSSGTSVLLQVSRPIVESHGVCGVAHMIHYVCGLHAIHCCVWPHCVGWAPPLTASEATSARDSSAMPLSLQVTYGCV